MKIILFVLLFLPAQNLEQNVIFETDSFFVWEILDLKQAENTGFTYQDCDFINLLLESVRLGIVRPYTNDSLQTRLSQEDYLNRINNTNILSEIILKSKVRCYFDEISEQEIIAISIFSTKGNLICAFSYDELEQNLFIDNSEAMICLGENLKISLVEVFENHSFKTKFLKRVKIE